MHWETRKFVRLVLLQGSGCMPEFKNRMPNPVSDTSLPLPASSIVPPFHFLAPNCRSGGGNQENCNCALFFS